MSNKLEIVVHDHTNFTISGLTGSDIKEIEKATGIMVKGAFTSAAFKNKIWDGKESLFLEGEEPGTGIGCLYEIDKVLDALENIGFSEDDFELIDNRDTVLPDIIHPEVDENFLLEESGFTLRDYQVDAINAAIEHRKGVLDIGTNGGKSWICVGISKAFNQHLKTVVIVPSEKLVKQTYEDYKKSTLDVAILTSSVKPEKREGIINSHRHIILTTNLFLNVKHIFARTVWGMLIDEAHRHGDKFSDALRFDMGHCPLRIGMSGSIPKKNDDPYKRNKIFSVVGGGVLVRTKQKTLIERGVSAELNIRMIETSHPSVEEIYESMEGHYDWSIEESYNLTNVDRLTTVADLIRKNHEEDPINTLILCHNGAGKILSKILDCGLIVDETPSEERDELFDRFDDTDGHMFCATFGTSGTGISSNRIFRMYLIDVGKNDVYIMQGIGRGLRIDGVVNKVEVIDISSSNKYAKRHRAERKKIYVREHFPFSEKPEKVLVMDDCGDLWL